MTPDPPPRAIGEVPELAGAPGLIRYLRDLPQITRFKVGLPAQN